nr:CDP-glycerol glycerophosphotransferase family protein [Mammaliicoccus sp. Marseille-Q6498]
MKVLQVLFDLKSKNGKAYNAMKKNDFFIDTIIVDVNKRDERIQVSMEKYDYIVYTNSNYTMDNETITNVLENMKNKNKPITQFTLRNCVYNKQFKYNEIYYNDLFTNMIVDTKIHNTNDVLEIYFKTKLSLRNDNHILVHTNHIDGDIDEKSKKEDLINLAILLLIHSENKSLMNSFENEYEVIKFLEMLVNNQVFEKNINKSTQFLLLDLIKKHFQNFELLRKVEYTSLHLFFELTMKGYYDEAIKALTLLRSSSYWSSQYNKHLVSLGNERIDIRLSNAWKKTQKFRDARIQCKKQIFVIEKCILKFISKIYKLLNRKETWIISERIDSASDNSYYLFEFLRNNRKDIKAFYLIDKSAHKSIEKLKNLGNYIYIGSIKHKLFMLIADKYITSFTFEETMTPYNAQLYKELYKRELDKKTVISIQHGMIIHNISPYLNKNHYKLNYITANSKYEKKIIKETLGFKDEEVLITGMARHDNLIKNSKQSNQILYMPTWQRGLEKLNELQFIESEYFMKMDDLLNNEQFIQFLKSNKLELNVLMHPQFEKFSKNLRSNHDCIKFAKAAEVEIPKLISDSLFLITDFSSVAVDFLFQRKNVIFYQYNKYVSHHVPSMDIKYSDIGEVVENLDELLESLNKYKEKNFRLLPKYENSYEKLFEVRSNICEKIVNSILKIGE